MQVIPFRLDDAWRDALARVADARGWPSAADPKRLGDLVRDLSRVYNEPRAPDFGEARAMLPARLGFSFPRDVAKGARALRDLIATGRLFGAPPGRTAWRVLDVGAGLGAMTWGLVHELEDAASSTGSGPFSVDATFIDSDADALAVAVDLARVIQRPSVRVTLEPRRTDLTRALPPRAALDGFDLVLVGQVLSELDVGIDPDARAKLHAGKLADLLGRVRPGGALVVVEPALRDRTRHLHAVRDLLASAGHPPFAPCLHAKPCPMLMHASDWCHEDLPVDLPAWLAPVARAAGLRWEGLTFSYLVLTPDGASLRSSLPDAPVLLRVVSQRIKSKGKEELVACGQSGDMRGAIRLRRLDRARSSANATWDDLTRGDCFTSTSTSREIGKDDQIEAVSPVDERLLDRYLEGP